MANIRKTFNFRNGVQVDDDNLVVNTNGLVGIGTSVPTESLDVRGTSKFVGLVTATEIFAQNIRSSGVSTFSSGIKVGIVSISEVGIVTATSGIVTYYGDGGKLLNLPTSQWLDIDVGLGFTSIYAQGFVGITTNSPIYPFQVAGSSANRIFNAVGAKGVGIDSTGNIYSTGIITATSYNGIGVGLTDLNASNIAYGTLNTNRLPSNINVSGIVTATTFVGNLTGTASTAQSLTGTPNITVNYITSSNINSSGIVTATTISSSTINNSGSIVNGGSITNTNLITTNSLVANNSISSTNLLASGITTSTTLLHVGSNGTGFSALSSGRIGIGSAVPTSELQIRKSSGSLLEVISETGSARISVGQTVGAGKSTGLIRFGNSNNDLDIVNNDNEGNINFLLNGNGSAGSGKFSWQDGSSFTEVMGLGANGNFSVSGITTLASSGGITTTGGDLYVGNDIYISGNINGTITLPSVFNGNVNATSGVSTFSNVIVSDGSSLGIGSTAPKATIDAIGKTVLLGKTGINRDNLDFNTTVYVDGTAAISDRVAIGRTEPLNGGSGLEIHGSNGISGSLDLYETGVTIRSAVSPAPFINVSVVIDDKTNVGIGSTQPKAAIDLSDAGKGAAGGQYAYIIMPTATDSEKVGFTTTAGAIIFNSTLGKFQGYTGIGWTDLH